MSSPKRIFEFIARCFEPSASVNAAIFNTMRILKKVNPGDTYLENYLWHYEKNKDKFIDTYHLMWEIGANIAPSRILEIGTRTGISIAQLLSPMSLPHQVRARERIVLVDLFNDGFISPELVKLNLKYLNIPLDKIEIITGDSKDVLPVIASQKQLFDYILIDGCHEKDVAREDLENAVPLLDVSGIILFDDLGVDGCSLKDVWIDFQAVHAEFLYCQNYIDGKGVGVGVKLC
jgi:predicted O-methyltransferase YrrM